MFQKLRDLESMIQKRWLLMIMEKMIEVPMFHMSLTEPELSITPPSDLEEMKYSTAPAMNDQE